MTAFIMKTVARTFSVPGIGGISQAVAGDIVAKCADPSLSDQEFARLMDQAESQGYELKPVAS
jgi:hypothetical protein